MLTVPVPTGTQYNDSRSDSSCEQNGNQVRCAIGTLRAGRVRGLTVSFTIGNTASCGNFLQVSGTVSTTTTDSNSSNNTATSSSDVTVECNACNDGVDNDGDGLVDSQDPGCSSPDDDDERDPNGPECDNGRDDDNDGRIDFPNDPECSSPTDDTEALDFTDMQLIVTPLQPEAHKGEDARYRYTARNNGPAVNEDTTVIVPIPFGLTYKDSISDTLCGQNGNNVVCSIGTLPVHQNRQFTIGFTVAQTAICNADVQVNGRVESTTPDANPTNNTADATLVITCTECSDGVDNDGDGKIDAQDAGCDNNQDDDEDSDLGRVVTISPEGVIRDTTPTYVWESVRKADDYELWVSRKSTQNIALINEYTSKTTLKPSFELTPGEEYSFWVRARNNSTLGPWSAVRHFTVENVLPKCSDGIDNDGDGATDFPADFSCSSANDDDEANPKAKCQDGIDNDGDGKIDSQDAGCDNNQDDDEFNVLHADVIIQKFGPSTVTKGNTVVYTVHTTNLGPDTAENVTVSDRVPAGFSFKSSISSPNCVLSGHSVSCNNVTLLRGESHTFQIGFDVTSSATCNSTIHNTATVSTSSTDPVHSNNTSQTVSSTVQCPLPECSDGVDNDGDGATDFPADFSCSGPNDDDEGDILAACQDGVDNDGDNLVDFPQDPGCDSAQDNDEVNAPAPTDLSITLFGPTTIRKSESLPYSVIVNNLGPDDLANPAEFSVAVPANYTFSNTASDSNCQLNGGNVRCTTNLLQVGQNQTYSVVFNPLGSANTCGSTIRNQANITNVPQGDSNPANNQSTTVATSVTCSQCSDGIDNDGDGATDFPNDFSCQSPDDNNESDPMAQCQDGIDNDGDGHADFPQDPGCDSAQDNDEFNQIKHDLFITKSGPVKIQRGNTVIYTLTATNLGPHTATNVHILDEIPAGLTFDPSNSSNNCVQNGGNIICNNFSLQNQESRTVNVAFTVSTGLACGSQIRNIGIVNTSATDLNPKDNRMEIFTEVDCSGQNPTLTISKTDNRTTAAPGDTLNYTITVSNTSNFEATGVDVSDSLPTGVEFVSASHSATTGGNSQSNATVVLWSGLTVPAGQSITLNLSVRVKNDVANGTVLLNNVQVNGGATASDATTVQNSQPITGCIEIFKVAQDLSGNFVTPVPSFTFRLNGNQATTNDVNGYARFVNVPAGQHTVSEDALHGWNQVGVVPSSGVVNVVPGASCAQVAFANRQSVGSQQPTYSITKTDNVGAIQAGQNLTYTIVVTNTSSVPAVSVRVVDILPPELTFLSANNGGGLQGGEVVWNNLSLNPGQSITLQIQTLVRANVAPNTVIFNIAQVIGSAYSSNQSVTLSANNASAAQATALDTTTVLQPSVSSSSSSSVSSVSSSSSSVQSSIEFEDDVVVIESEFEEVINPFSDTVMTTLEGQAAADLYYSRIIGGFSDGTFRGARFTNRAEIAKFISLALGDNVPNLRNNGQFSDVKDGEWYVKYVMNAVRRSFADGYLDGTFGPGKPVNTAEFLKMVTLAFGLEQNLSHSYADIEGSSWYAPYAGVAEKYNLFPARGNQLTPSAAMSRKDIVIAIYQLLKNR